MRIVCAAAMIALLAGPAVAQQAQDPVQRAGEADKEKTPQQKAADKEAERAYQRSLGNIPEKASGDPWGTVRSDGPPKNLPKSAAKSASSKAAKTNATPN